MNRIKVWMTHPALQHFCPMKCTVQRESPSPSSTYVHPAIATHEKLKIAAAFKERRRKYISSMLKLELLIFWSLNRN